MVMEYKTVNVSNNLEDKTISTHTHFGWSLKSSQRVFNQDSHNEYSSLANGNVYVETVTETVDFTKLVFERDKNMPNYDRIVRLEQRAFKLLDEMDELHAVSQKGYDVLIEAEKSIDVRSNLSIIRSRFLMIAPIILSFLGMITVIIVKLDSDAIPAIEALGVLLSIIATIRNHVKKRSAYKNMMENRDAYPKEYARFLERWEQKVKKSAQLSKCRADIDAADERYSVCFEEAVDLMDQSEALLKEAE